MFLNSVKLSFEVGVCGLQGRRPYMEDRNTLLVDFIPEPDQSQNIYSENTEEDKEENIKAKEKQSDSDNSTKGKNEERPKYSFFAVYDGHGGQLASTFAASNVHKKLAKSSFILTDPIKALEEACDQTDKEYASVNDRLASSQDGSTACMILIRGTELFAANIGDSRAVLCRNRQAFALTSDHKPDNEGERKRIENAGGVVKKGYFFNIAIGPYRVYQGDGVRGGLAVSRAIGDTFYKDPTKPKEQWLVSGVPDITQETLVPGRDEFIIIASDGFWDVFTNEDSVKKLIELEKKGKSPNEISAELAELAFHRESLDNITVMVIKIVSTDVHQSNIDSNTITTTQSPKKENQFDVNNNNNNKQEEKEKEKEKEKENKLN